jgi:type VI secretion system protein ImpG
LGRGTRWRLISHLNLNYLSLVDGENGPEMLRELLRLYDFDDSPATRAMIDGVVKIDTQQAMAQVKADGITALCRVLDVSLTLDEDRFQGQGLYLFASVMERFFALYAPLNSFTRLTLRTKRRQAPIKIWLPRAGEKILV